MHIPDLAAFPSPDPTFPGSSTPSIFDDILTTAPSTTSDQPPSLSPDSQSYQSATPHPGLTLSVPKPHNPKKRGRPPTKRPTPEAEEDDEEDVLVKRARNNVAAKKYRQKKLDRISELEEEVDEVKKERDDLKVKLARREAEVEALREMLKMVQAGKS
ncbi:hypothetical protein B0H67DRAFT_571788 [Lasiosphaeris hirsuta]|uniref:BZIP domain-containing protein n=1 Tax=Lasiosphaeris hirsuta TaxID=260670 RepID=A0AA40B1C6_9PEZI|nr:hypothetical protein B0H67DRAFT_571788 [Lasiosphaeris hirsuta]